MARGNVSNTGLMMARLCYDLLMEKGRDALDAVDRHQVTPELEDVVEASIYLSGLGFENGGLAAAHAINDGFAQEPQAHGMYHGEKVAFGTLTQLVLERAGAGALLPEGHRAADDPGSAGGKRGRARNPEESGGGRLRSHTVHPESAGRHRRPGGL